MLRSFDVTTPSSQRSSWALVYATVDMALEPHHAALQARIRGPVFGCTSSRGVFSERGFLRGAFGLAGDDSDARVVAALKSCTPSTARRLARDAAQTLTQALGQRPDALLLHATPGFEERLVEGIADAFDGTPPPAYGGSAADDDLSGRWSVFLGRESTRDGFVLAALASPRPLLGSFVSGYVAGREKGRVTRAMGRVVWEIDGKPAAEVYDGWTRGSIRSAIDAGGGVILQTTTLRPVGRELDRVGNVPRFLLSHPHEVRRDGGLTFFTEVAVGDEVAIMLGSADSLVDRTAQAAGRALGRASSTARGGILVFCGGCVMALGDAVNDVGGRFQRSIGGAPFVGAATYGEIGCFPGPTPTNRHGNLMCDALLFA